MRRMIRYELRQGGIRFFGWGVGDATDRDDEEEAEEYIVLWWLVQQGKTDKDTRAAFEQLRDPRRGLFLHWRVLAKWSRRKIFFLGLSQHVLDGFYEERRSGPVSPELWHLHDEVTGRYD